MNFHLSQDQLSYQSMARDFASRELAPHAAHWDQEKIFPREALKKAADLGFAGVYVRDDVGGTGLNRLDGIIIFEELATGCTSTTAYLTIHNMVTWMIDEFGSEEIRQKFCPKLTSGVYFGSYCLTEPNSGSDASSLVTQATKEDGYYSLRGSKAFVSGGGQSDILVVMARTGELGPKGISAFVVPADSPGITFGKNEKKLGWNSQPTCIINFDHVKVPKEYLLGQEGEGFKIAMKGLDGGRINISSCSIGAAQACLEHTKHYIQERKQFGKHISSFQVPQFRMADFVTRLVAARQMVRMAASKLDANEPDASTYCAMAKLFCTDTAFDICNSSLQLFGGYGFTQEYPIERFMRDCRAHQIIEGTNEIMHIIIARRILEENSKLPT